MGKIRIKTIGKCLIFGRTDNNNNWTAKVSWNIDGNKNSWTNAKLPEAYSYSTHPQNPPLPFNFLKSNVYLKLAANNLAKAAYSDEVTPRLEFDGSGLAPTLDFLRNETPDKFQLIEEKLSRIVPNVRKLGIKRAKVPVIRNRLIEVDGKSISYDESQEMTGQEVVLDMNTGERIPAHAISEGTMLTLGLLTVLMNPNQPNLVLLDDVEQGLHPQAQRELMTVIKGIIPKIPTCKLFSLLTPHILLMHLFLLKSTY